MNTKYLILPLLLLFCFSFISSFSGLGDGSSGSPYQITNCTQLQEMEDNYGYYPSSFPYYILMNNIDCSDTYNWNIGLGFDPIVPVDAPFGASGGMWYGDFNGQGYTISGLYINRPLENYLGFFRFVANGGTVNNFNCDNCYVFGSGTNTGSIVGFFESGNMDSVNFTGENVGFNPVGDCHIYDADVGQCFQHVGCDYDFDLSLCNGTFTINELYGGGNPTVTNSFFTYQAYVYSPFVNTPPVITTLLSEVNITIGETLTYDYNATDVDLDVLTWSDNTTLFNIDSSTGIISFSPLTGEGQYIILITVSDGTDTDTDTFILNILAQEQQSSPITGTRAIITSEVVQDGPIITSEVNEPFFNQPFFISAKVTLVGWWDDLSQWFRHIFTFI